MSQPNDLTPSGSSQPSDRRLHGWGLALGFGVRALQAPCLQFD